MPDMDMPGRLVVDVALGDETVFSFPESVDPDGHWAIEVFREFEDGTPAPFAAGTYRLAVHCLPADTNVSQPVAEYEPLSFTVVADAPAPEEPAPEQPAPAEPVTQRPRFTG